MSLFDIPFANSYIPYKDGFCGLQFHRGHIILRNIPNIIIFLVISAINLISLVAVTLYSLHWA